MLEFLSPISPVADQFLPCGPLSASSNHLEGGGCVRPERALSGLTREPGKGWENAG